MMSPASIESKARMTPSLVLKWQARPRIVCGCCHRRAEQAYLHPLLGPLCVWCGREFDLTLDRYGRDVRPEDHCPLCLEAGRVCVRHE